MAEPTEGSQLTPLGKFVSIALILGLIGVGAWVVYAKMSPQDPPKTGGGSVPPPVQAGGGTAPTPPAGGAKTPSEAVDPAALGLTVKTPTYKPQERLPAVKGASAYKWDAAAKTLVFSYNVWGGWIPVIAANGGTEPNADSVFFKKYGFKVQMKLMDDPVAARDAFALGEVHTLWGTLDMMVLFAPDLMKDSRTAPRIVQQIDWSTGGDGIVARTRVKSVNDLRGKKIALAQNSPSEYYLNSLILTAGLKPSDIKPVFTATAFDAAAAFVTDAGIDACVSWAPDIYRIADNVPGTKLLSTTGTANKLIADVYAVRADFAKDHPDIVEGLVAGIFEGMSMVKADPNPAAQAMAKAFGMKTEDVMGMLQDFHLTNRGDNVEFFLNTSNPTNFERTWNNASFVYRQLGRIGAPTPYDQVKEFTYIQAIDQKKLFKEQTASAPEGFTPSNPKKFEGVEAVVTQTIRINFYPNSANPYEPARDATGNVMPGKLYDPNVDETIEHIGRLAGQMGRAVIVIEGHTDGSMRGKAPAQAVKELSEDRARAIQRALVEKFKFDPNKFVISGRGWDEPFDASDPNNHILNRRVEIGVFEPEK